MSNVFSLVIAPAEASLPVWPEGCPPDVNVWDSVNGEPSPFSHSEGEQHWLHWPGVARFRFAADGDAVTAVPYEPARPDEIRTRFYHNVLPLALQARGCEGLHASGILTDHGVVGFCGGTHSGKSTLAYALGQRGLTPWSDDALVWEIENQRPVAMNLPFEFRLRPPSLSFFGDRSSSDLNAAQAHRPPRAPLSALYALTRVPVDPHRPRVAIHRMAGGRVLTRLLDHAHCFNPRNAARKHQMLLNYLVLLSRVPVFELQFQPSLSFIPELADAVMHSASTV